MIPLENAQRQMLEQIKQFSAMRTRPQIEDEELQKVLEYVMKLGYVTDNGDYWELTEKGRRILEHEQTTLHKEESEEKQQHTENTRDWLSLTVSAIALIVSIIALVLK